MIKIENLKKVYVSKNGQKCGALNGVNITFPEQGMVFVVGQSGSGKSTLLNLLGGLDSITDGEIIVDGAKFSQFKDKDYDNYRKSYVGFVFQDYCLLENMTIYQNIRIGLDLQGDIDNSRVDQILKTVGLEGYGSRYPRELSGGQKQRIGLARALVKNPKLILADEPTGNLDSKFSTQVLDFLKELSKDRLVVIVSHNTNDAIKYADRIIELDDGVVISDTTRVAGSQEKLVDEKTINLPLHKRLTKDELEEVNKAVFAGGHEVVQVTKNFVATKPQEEDNKRKYSVSDKSLTFGGKMFLSRKLMKGNILNLVVTAISVSMLIILLSICQIFMFFSGNDLTRESIKEDTVSFTISKGYRKGDKLSILWAEKLVEITNEEIDEFYDAGYKGNIFKLYNVNMPVNYSAGNPMISGSQIEYKVLNNFYLDSGRGVLECSKDFLTKIYGVNGKLKVLAGDINDDTKKAGLVITDYFADSLIYYNTQQYTTYEDIIAAETVGANSQIYSVKAIIDTGYKTEYAGLINEFKTALNKPSSVDRKTAIATVKNSDEYAVFREDLIAYLSIGYFLGNDYESVVLDTFSNKIGFYFQNPSYVINGKDITLPQYQIRKWTNSDLEPGQMIMGNYVYNAIFKTSYNQQNIEEIDPFDLGVNVYSYTADFGKPDMAQTFNVVDYNISSYIYVGEEDFEKIARHTIINYSLYFDNPESFAGIVDSSVIDKYFSSSDYFRTIFSVLDVVNVFGDFFLLLFIGLALVCALLVCSYTRRTVKRKYYDIGVIRALGGRNSSISFAFIFQLLVLSVSILTLSIVGMSILDSIINTVLVENLANLMVINPISGLTIISFDPISVGIIVLTVLLLCVISVYTMISLSRRVKPINIIRKNHN